MSKTLRDLLMNFFKGLNDQPFVKHRDLDALYFLAREEQELMLPDEAGLDVFRGFDGNPVFKFTIPFFDHSEGFENSFNLLTLAIGIDADSGEYDYEVHAGALRTFGGGSFSLEKGLYLDRDSDLAFGELCDLLSGRSVIISISSSRLPLRFYWGEVRSGSKVSVNVGLLAKLVYAIPFNLKCTQFQFDFDGNSEQYRLSSRILTWDSLLLS